MDDEHPHGTEPAEQGNHEEEEIEHKQKLGVLFVHGLGEARQGETLLRAGEPLFNWLRYWVQRSIDTGVLDCERDNICLEKTFLSRPDPDPTNRGAPAYTVVEFRAAPSEGTHKWVMAECWWAGDFPQASFSSLWNWAIGVVPWLFASTARNIVQQLKRVGDQIDHMVGRQLEEARQNNPLLSFPLQFIRVLVSAFLLTAQILLTVFLTPLILLGGLLAQLLIMALAVLGAFPPARGLIVSIQQNLATNLGDGYVIAASPLSLDAMSTQVQHDIAWLKEKMGCTRIAIIAHSGGTAVAYHALLDSQTLPVDLLVTYGNGLSKLELIRKALNQRGWAFAAGSVLRVIAILSFAAAIISVIAEEPPPWALTGALFAFSLVLEYVSRRLSESNKSKDDFSPVYPKTKEWLDFYAAADPAPDGPIPRPENTDGRVFSSTLVTNLNSLLKDHGQYWYNNEQFLAPVIRALNGLVGLEHLITSADETVIKGASAERRIRAFLYMAAGLMLVLETPVLWLSLGKWLYDAGRWLVNPLTRILTGSAGIFQEPTRLAVAVYVLVGVLIFTIPVVMYKNSVLFTLWREWSAVETDAMFERSRERRGGALAWSFLLALLAVPVILCLAAFTGFTDILGPNEVNLQVVWTAILTWLVGAGTGASPDEPAAILAIITQAVAVVGLVLGVGITAIGVLLSSFKLDFLAGWEEKYGERESEEISIAHRLLEKLGKLANPRAIGILFGAFVLLNVLCFALDSQK